MKGAIVNCLQELVVKSFGKEKWERILEKSGFASFTMFLPIQDVDDGKVLNLVGNVCSTLNLTLPQAADAFGDYWMCNYAPNHYRSFFSEQRTAKDFLMQMDKVHQTATATIPNAHPPRFEYTWENDKTLVMKYHSPRNLMDFMVGLVKGVGKHFNENLSISKNSDSSVRIVFP